VATNSHIARGIAMSRWFFLTTALNNILTADRAQMLMPATNVDYQASNDSASVNIPAVRMIASRVGQEASRNLRHQPSDVPVFLGTSFSVFCWAICWTFAGFCRSHSIEFAIVGTTSNPRPQGQ